jgi:hypothetical protein
MKSIYVLIVFILSTPVLACKSGYEPSDVEGVCVESSVNPSMKYASDEKPPSDRMPSYEREGVKILDAPDLTKQDEQLDKEKDSANKAGKKEAGIK